MTDSQQYTYTMVGPRFDELHGHWYVLALDADLTHIATVYGVTEAEAESRARQAFGALDLLPNVAKLLRRIEWAWYEGSCAFCGKRGEQTHYKDCELAAHLAEIDTFLERNNNQPAGVERCPTCGSEYRDRRQMVTLTTAGGADWCRGPFHAREEAQPQ